MSLTAIETSYAGRKFRSRTEARWAVFFDAAGIKWDYEKDGFDLGEEGLYLPDFWLPELAAYAEVKGQDFSVLEINRCRKLAKLSGHSVIMLPGVPAATVYRAERPDGLIEETAFGLVGEHIWAEAVARATSARFEHGESPRQDRVSEQSSSVRVRRGERRGQSHERGSAAERELVRAMLHQPELIPDIATKVDPGGFRTSAYRTIVEALVAGQAVTDAEAKRAMNEILEEGAIQVDSGRAVTDALATLRARDLDMRAAELDRLIPLAAGEAKDALIAEKDAIRRELKATGRNYFRKFRGPNV